MDAENSLRKPGAAALDRHGKCYNYALKYVPEASRSRSQADEYLRLRQAELTCRRLGSALRQLREGRGFSREDLATEIGMPRGIVEGMETGDPHVGVRMWMNAWEWMGVASTIHQVARNGTESWGDALKVYRGEQRISKSEMAARIGVSRSTIEAMEANLDTVRIHAWIHAWRAMGIENGLVEAADPGMQIVVASAKALADSLGEISDDV